MDLLNQFLSKDVSWILAAAIFLLGVGGVLWLWKSPRRNGHAKHLHDEFRMEERVTMLEGRVTVAEGKLIEATAILHSMENGVGEATKTVNRLREELAHIKGKLSILVGNLKDESEKTTE